MLTSMASNVALALMLLSVPVAAEPFVGPPDGFTLVAEDDCGDPDASPHVVRGTVYAFSASAVSGPREERDIVFDNEFCLLRYEGLNPQAQYKVDVTYVTEPGGLREQTLEANGVLVHERMRLPAGKPGRFLFSLPAAAHAEGKPVELKCTICAGANAVVSYVRLWSTDPRPLPGHAAFWAAGGPIEKDWLRQDRMRGKPRFADWENPAREVRESVVPCLNEQLERGRRLLEDQGRTDPGPLAAVRQQRDALLATANVSPEAWLAVYKAARWAVRRIAFADPRLGSEGLLFVRRHHPNAMHQCARRLGSFTLPGGDICLLTNLRADEPPEVVSLTQGLFPRGTFGRPDLSFDGKRIVFGHARERDSDSRGMDYGGISEQTAPLYAEHRVGPCHEFQVFEMSLGGEPAPRQLTQGPAENSDPLYLPDGRLAFMSHRAGGLVQCGDWALAYCVYTMNPDGSDVRKITMSKDGEWDPFLLADGTIGFTRWEYVMKFWSPIQMLWSVRPDGGEPRLIYGSDLSKQYAYPLNYASARQIPGSSKLVCIGSAHHNTGAGPLCLVDLAIGPNEAQGLERLTPVRFVETPDQQPNNGWYDCPYPLSEHCFLVSYSFSTDETDTTGYGIYLFDTFGGKELIYRDEELSALFPMPIRPRPRPGAVVENRDVYHLPPTSAANGERPHSPFGEFIVQDVHEGLAPDQQGRARYLQVVECHERLIHTSPYAIEVGPDCGFETKTVLGTVPVERDGSAYFRVPAEKSVFFSVLDENYRALHTMRSVTNLQPGERTACIGCHEGFPRVPAVRDLAAMRRGPSDLEPPPWGVRPMEFASIVQPVLDRRCAACHDGAPGERKSFDLTAQHSQPFMGVPLPVSYYNLRAHVRHAPIFQYFLAPGSFGSRVSPAMDLLAKGHYGVTLDSDEWRRLCAWIDCNAPGIGDYEAASYANRRRHAEELRREIAARPRTTTVDRRRVLAERLPPDERLACYLDCGPVGEDAGEGGVLVREIAGSPHVYGAGEGIVPPWQDDISFDGARLTYEVTGLRRDRAYQLGFSWWDHNNAGREQSVTAISAAGERQLVLGRTRLPAWVERNEKPAELRLPLAAEVTQSGSVTLYFTLEGDKGNAVLSELWLTEK